MSIFHSIGSSLLTFGSAMLSSSNSSCCKTYSDTVSILSLRSKKASPKTSLTAYSSLNESKTSLSIGTSCKHKYSKTFRERLTSNRTK